MLISWLLIVAGVGMLGMALLDARSTRLFIERAQRAEGVVTSLYAGAAHPKVEFKTPAGDPVTIAGTGFTRHRQGQSVRVLYLPNLPEHAKLDEPGVLWFSACMTGLLGAALLAAGCIKLRSG